jgi:prepilin-type processing-associated H-X9-DG protein
MLLIDFIYNPVPNPPPLTGPYPGRPWQYFTIDPMDPSNHLPPFYTNWDALGIYGRHPGKSANMVCGDGHVDDIRSPGLFNTQQKDDILQFRQ